VLGLVGAGIGTAIGGLSAILSILFGLGTASIGALGAGAAGTAGAAAGAAGAVPAMFGL
jgi:hypothetical protein